MLGKILGTLLVAAGTLILLLHGLPYRSSKTVDLGSTEITEKSDRTLPLSPIVGGLVFLSGVGVLLVAVKRK
jgi:hypothetical protein